MRQERSVQASLFDLFAGHEIGRELKAMSAWLEGHRALLSLVAADLCRRRVKETGRQGLPAEAVLRCAVLKQHRQLSYQELAFHLEDSASFRAFAGCRTRGARRSRSCTRRSAQSVPRLGSRSTARC
jgi:IS5 family transposase